MQTRSGYSQRGHPQQQAVPMYAELTTLPTTTTQIAHRTARNTTHPALPSRESSLQVRHYSHPLNVINECRVKKSLPHQLYHPQWPFQGRSLQLSNRQSRHSQHAAPAYCCMQYAWQAVIRDCQLPGNLSIYRRHRRQIQQNKLTMLVSEINGLVVMAHSGSTALRQTSVK